MANLGILEGVYSQNGLVRRGPTFGTLASSRSRRPVGPQLFGNVLTPQQLAAIQAKAGQAARDATAAAAKAGTSGPGIAASGKHAYDKVIEEEIAKINAANIAPPPVAPPPPATPPESTPSPSTKSQDELRKYYEVDKDGAATPPPPANIPSGPISQEDLRKPGFSDTTVSAAPAAPQAKNLLVPIAAIAAAYLFLK